MLHDAKIITLEVTRVDWPLPSQVQLLKWTAHYQAKSSYWNGLTITKPSPVTEMDWQLPGHS